MLRRFAPADWAAALGASLGLLAVYLPWYSYASGASRISVNAFRASVLGDFFFVAVAAAALLLLARQGFIDDRLTGRVKERAAFTAIAASAAGIVVLQLVLTATRGRSTAGGFILAVVAAIAFAASAWMRPPDWQSHSGNETGREPLTD